MMNVRSQCTENLLCAVNRTTSPYLSRHAAFMMPLPIKLAGSSPGSSKNCSMYAMQLVGM